METKLELQNIEANIAAMQKLLKWYEKVKNFQINGCPLCRANIKCSTCPWVTLIGTRCSSHIPTIRTLRAIRQADFIEFRIPELKEWIKIYEDYLQENNQ